MSEDLGERALRLVCELEEQNQKLRRKLAAEAARRLELEAELGVQRASVRWRASLL